MKSHSPTCSSDYPPISDRYVCVSLPALPHMPSWRAVGQISCSQTGTLCAGRMVWFLLKTCCVFHYRGCILIFRLTRVDTVKSGVHTHVSDEPTASAFRTRYCVIKNVLINVSQQWLCGHILYNSECLCVCVCVCVSLNFHQGIDVVVQVRDCLQLDYACAFNHKNFAAEMAVT
jgi:hypothetical protein